MAPLNEESVQEVADEGQEVELTPEQKTAQLTKLMAEGKRELKAGNFEKCSEKFGEAAEFAAKHYGELAEESFEPNFQYGRALVELSTVENDLFKTALIDIVKKDAEEAEEKDGDESMTEEEKDDVREMVADALTENAEELEKKAADGTEEESKDEEAKGDQPEEESKEEKTEEENAEAGKDSTDNAAAGDNKEEAAENEEKGEAMDDEEGAEKEDIEDGDEDDEEEDLDNNQLAWEALEVASKIADKMISETSSGEWKKKRADVFVQLAQCTANDENYDQALEDLGRALDLMTETEKFKEDRLTAEIYFHMGRINRLRNEFTIGEESFNKAAGLFENLLEVKKAEAGENPTDDQKVELEELEAVIKDFKERAEDCKASEVQKKMMTMMAQKEKEENPSILTSSNANSDPTANDISSLVRKKRAHEDSEAEKDPKRAKSEGMEEMPDENVAV